MWTAGALITKFLIIGDSFRIMPCHAVRSCAVLCAIRILMMNVVVYLSFYLLDFDVEMKSACIEYISYVTGADLNEKMYGFNVYTYLLTIKISITSA